MKPTKDLRSLKYWLHLNEMMILYILPCTDHVLVAQLHSYIPVLYFILFGASIDFLYIELCFVNRSFLIQHPRNICLCYYSECMYSTAINGRCIVGCLM